MTGAAVAAPPPARGRVRRAAVRPRVYLAYARAGWRQEAAALPVLIGRAAFLAVILFVFAQIWNRVLGGAVGAGGDALESRSFLWYLAVTEWIVLSFPYVHWEVEQDVRTGAVAARLSLPVSYVGARVAEGAGAGALRLLCVGAAAFALARAFAGGFPAHPVALLVVVPLGLLGILLGLLSVTAIGVGAVWLHDASPLFWVWQKLTFVLGGLMLPLAIYPRLLRVIAEWTPFGAMLNGPARQLIALDPRDAALVAAQLLAWNGAAALLLAWLWRRAGRALEAQGG